MKKKLLLSFLVASLLIAAVGVGAYAASKMTIVVNGKVANVEAKVINGVTYLPLRATGELLGADVQYDAATGTVHVTNGVAPQQAASTVTLIFPADKYPETAAHIVAAIAKGKPAVCTIDREGADHNRDQSLKGIATKDGYDRDEWPMAMCAEGGTGADVAYVESSDNRGSGSWVGNQLADYPDGTKVLFKISGTVAADSTVQPAESGADENEVTYTSCSAVKAAGKAPIHTGDPGYSRSLDRDGDGVACEAA